MSIEPGDQIGAYRIEARIGQGGVGTVYRARDERLKRAVALKVLPADLTRDHTAKARFVQEAQAASALDHPNICTIYDIGEANGQLYLSMAYYDGGSLKQRLTRGPVALDEVVEIAIQVAQGLTKAHASGIVHRDIKPANLMLTSDGVVKIVDFGLAKLAGQTGITRVGTAVGTATHMSPEQVQGTGVDWRTDLWALGVVLYELICGRVPFTGDRFLTVTAIVQGVPPRPSVLRAGVSRELERVVERALAKRAKDRYQSATEMIADLGRLRLLPDQAGAATLVTPRRPWRRRPRLAPAAGVMAVAGLAGYLTVARPPTSGGDLQLANITQATTARGVENYPAWSPDGQTLAYAANPNSDLYGGNWDIWLTQVGGGAPVNRTTDHTGDDRYPVWSPDGQRIAFWSAREGGGYFVMSALGGAPRKIVGTGNSPIADLSRPQWSPDGSRLATVAYDGAAAYLELWDLATRQRQRIALSVGIRALDLSWSPDGRYLAYVDAGDLSAQVTRLWIVRLADGSFVPVTDGRGNDWSPDWGPDGRTLYYVSNRHGSMDLWRQPLGDDATADGPPAPVTSGVGILRAALSPDGTRLAYARGRRIANLWRVPILDNRRATWADAEQLSFEEAFIEFIDVSPDGQTLVVDSDRNGNPDIFTLPVTGGEMRQLTSEPTPDWGPRWSPTGEAIAFYSYRAGKRDLWMMTTAGTRLRQLTDGDAEELIPAWSADARQLAFTSYERGTPDIAIVAAEGGPPRLLTRHPGNDQRADWSPDGAWLTFVSNRAGEFNAWRVPSGGGAPERVTEGLATYPRWSADGRRIYFTAVGPRAGNLWMVAPDQRIERAMTDFSGRHGSIGDVALATDGDYLYFTWEQDTGDIWVTDVTDPGS